MCLWIKVSTVVQGAGGALALIELAESALAVTASTVNEKLDVQLKTEEQKVGRLKDKEVCPEFLRTGSCSRRPSCKMSHNLNPVAPATIMQQQLGLTNNAQLQQLMGQNTMFPVDTVAAVSVENQLGNGKGSYFHWERGFCKNGNTCKFQHIPSLWGTRKRSNSHGSNQNQGFQGGAGLNLGALSVIQEQPGQPMQQQLNNKQQKRRQQQQQPLAVQQQQFQQQMQQQLAMATATQQQRQQQNIMQLPQFPVPAMNQNMVKEMIQTMQEGAQMGNKFKEDMAKAKLESMFRTAEITGDTATADMLRNATIHRS